MKSSNFLLPDGRPYIFKQSKCENYSYRFFVSRKYLTRTTKTSNLSLAKSTAETAYDSYRFNYLALDGRFSHSWEDAGKDVSTSLTLEEATCGSWIKTYNLKFGGSTKVLRINVPRTD